MEELYHSSYFEIGMNASSKIDKDKYDLVINLLSPALSSKFYQTQPKKAEALVEQYKKIKPDELEFFTNMPDKESSLDHVFKYYFKQFQLDRQKFGFEEALDKHQDFYFLCEEIYRELPASYVFSLINTMELLRK